MHVAIMVDIQQLQVCAVVLGYMNKHDTLIVNAYNVYFVKYSLQAPSLGVLGFHFVI